MLLIYDNRNNQKMEIEPSDSSTCTKAVQSDNVLSLSFVSYEYRTLEVNDYVDFCGERFWATEKYTPNQKSSVEWEYNIKLYGIESLIKRYLVVKLVNGDNETEFEYTATAYDHVTLIVQNINAGMETSDWKVGEVVASEYLDIAYEGTYCDEALKKVADLTGVEYWIDGTTVNVSRCEHSERITLGYNKGLISLYSDKADNVKLFTRLFPIGSTRNIAYDDYGHSRLQLPGGVTYLDQDTYKFGVVHHYEKEAFAHIYPRRVGQISSVRSQEEKGEDGKTFIIYYFKDSSLNFDPNDYELNGLVKMVSFQDNSSLAGRDFEVNYKTETKEFEIITQWPYDNDIQLPNEQLPPKRLDEYILWNIKMPIEYYALAEAEYKQAVEKFLKEQYNDVSVYKAHTDYVDIAERELNLTIGQRVRLEHLQYFAEGHRDSRITKITRKVVRPTDMDIEISDVLSKGALERVDDNIADVNHYTKVAMGGFPDIIKSWESTPPTDTNVFSSRKALKESLSRRFPDSATGFKQFLDGASFGEYIEGLTGTGGVIHADGAAELKSLALRSFLDVPELRYNRVEVIVGDRWRAPGGGLIESIDTENQIITLKLEDGEIGNISPGDICMGIFHSTTPTDNSVDDFDDSKGNRRFSGFYTVYFRITTVLNESRRQFQYQLRPTSAAYPKQYHPAEAMNFIAYGSFTDPSRQASVYETRTYQRYLTSVNGWEFRRENIAAQFGELSNLFVHGLNMSGYSAYLNNIYLNGVINQISQDGKTEGLIPFHKGNWKNGRYAYYDYVSHKGSLWLCINEIGTEIEPSESAADWLEWVSKGAAGVPGEPGEDGKVYYTWIRYADNELGGGMSNNPTGKTYIGFAYNKPSQTESDVPGDYAWSLIKGDKGAPGVPGAPGADGKVYYTWIRYADNAAGAGMTDEPTGKKYIGFAYNKPSQIESDAPGDYAWSLIKGDKGDTGVPGAPGANGQPTYTWIKYSDYSGGTGMYDTPTDNTKYIGFAQNKTTASESSNPADYVWSLIKGEKGDMGVPGVPGADGQPTYTWIKYSDYPDGTGMYDTPTDNTKYIGIAPNKTTASESSSPALYTWSKFKGEDGTPGDWVSYVFTSSTTQPATPTGTKPVPSGWVDTPSNSGIWWMSKSIVAGTTGLAGAWSRPIRVTGLDGTPGADGKYTVYNYAKNTSKTTPPPHGSSRWFVNPPSLNPEDYLWMRTGITVPPETIPSSWSVPVRINGEKGEPGDKGDPGVIFSGRMLYRDPEFRIGVNGITAYNWSGTVKITRIANTLDSPTTSNHCLQIQTTTAASPGLGGFGHSFLSRPNAVFIQKFVANIPAGYSVKYTSNAMGDGRIDEWLTPTIGTGKYETYIHRTTCGVTGEFSYGGYIYIDSATGYPFTWYLASATVYDTCDTENYDDAIADAGKAKLYQGMFFSNKIYYNNNDRQDLVKYSDGTWYRYIGVDGQRQYSWDAANWRPFGANFESMATSTLLSENANIADFIFKNAAIISQRGMINNSISSDFFSPNFVPFIKLNGNVGSGHLAGGNLVWDEFGNLQVAGKIESNKSGNSIVIDPSTRSIRLRNSDGTYAGSWDFNYATGGIISMARTPTGSKLRHIEIQSDLINLETISPLGATVRFRALTNGNLLALYMQGLPTSATGLSSGQLWRDGAFVKIVP